MLNFPNNPTGKVLSHQELQRVIDVCLEHSIYILYDNAYSHIVFDDTVYRNPYLCHGANECLIEIRSASKDHA